MNLGNREEKKFTLQVSLCLFQEVADHSKIFKINMTFQHKRINPRGNVSRANNAQRVGQRRPVEKGPFESEIHPTV